MNGTNARSFLTFIATTATAIGTVHIIRMTETDTVPDFMGDNSCHKTKGVVGIVAGITNCVVRIAIAWKTCRSNVLVGVYNPDINISATG